MNLFKYINDYFTRNNSNQTYGDIISGNKNNVVDSLSPNEKDIYNYFKSYDKYKAIRNENSNLIDNSKFTQRNVNVSGIGEITQIC